MNDDEQAEVIDLLSDILQWFNERSQPTSNRRYHSCPVCYSTWWDGGLFNREKHNHGCWVPELQGMVKTLRRQGQR